MNQRPIQVLPNAYSKTSAAPLTSFINPAAFALPAVGTLGNVGAFTIQGPAIWQFDLSLSRAFNVRESQRVEARFEAYKVRNSFRPQNPSAVVSQNTFGQIRQSYDPRIMQFALKYVF